MFHPAIATLAKGLMQNGADASDECRRAHTPTSSAHAKLTLGDVLVWVGPNLFNSVPWHAVGDAGVFRVFYDVDARECVGANGTITTFGGDCGGIESCSTVTANIGAPPS